MSHDVADGLMQTPFASESILPSELPSSTTKPQTVHLHANIIDENSSNSQVILIVILFLKCSYCFAILYLNPFF